MPKTLTERETLALTRAETKARDRIEASVSKYVLTKRFALLHRAALRRMIERGEAEIFESPTGSAYRLVKEPREGGSK